VNRKAPAAAGAAAGWLVEVTWSGSDDGWWIVSGYTAEAGAREEVRQLRGHYARKGQHMRVRQDAGA
jgi:hypothetical protein